MKNNLKDLKVRRQKKQQQLLAYVVILNLATILLQ